MTKANAVEAVKKHHWNLVLVEVVFTTSDDPTNISILKVQFPEKTDFKTFPSHRIQRLMNAGALQIKNGLPPDMQEKFKVHDAFLLAIQPLGQMTDEEFWRGRAQAPEIAESATPAPDNVVQLKAPAPAEGVDTNEA